MIKNIFIPEKIDSYFIFPKRIVGFDINKIHISATQVYVKGSTSIIEKCIEQKLEAGNASNYQERVTQAMQQVLKVVDRYDAIHTVLPSSVALFKSIKLPFMTYEKINMVINFEIEPLLPFSLNDAVIDFIITKTIPEEQSSEVLVAAVPNQHIAQHLNIFKAAGIDPDKITLDFFALYGLYKRIPAYTSYTGVVALLDIGLHTTRIGFIYNGQLKFIRTLAQGVSTIAKSVGTLLSMQPGQAMEEIIRFGVENSENPAYTQATKEALTSFWQEVSFTLDSFSSQADNQKTTKLLLFGNGAEIKELPSFITNLSTIKCEQFNGTQLLKDSSIQIKNNITIPSTSIISLSVALPSPITEHCNLRQGEFSLANGSLIYKQLLTAAILTVLLLGALFTHSFLQIKKLRNEADLSEKEAITSLREQFPKIEETQLYDVVEEAHNIVDEEEKLVSFINPARISFLKYLLELTNKIDKDGLNLKTEKIILFEDTMLFKARVDDFEALKMLERDLRQSKLFSYIEPQEKTEFTMKIGLVKNDGEN